MNGKDVAALYATLESQGIPIWIDGGWAVDALLGRQTREHSDLDIAIEERHVAALRRHLESQGYRDVPRDDTSQWNFVLGDGHGREVDIHAFVFDNVGDVVDGIKYPRGSLSGTGTIAGASVRCIAAEHLVKFHSGYPLRESDWNDVAALCEHFALPYPAEYGPGAQLMSDDYSGLELGMFSGGVVGAMTEYHYLAATAPRGNWTAATFRGEGSQRAWRVIVDDRSGRRCMHQSYNNPPSERPYTRPVVIAGDELWTDYILETTVTPEVLDGDGISGVLFRYRNNRRFYFAGVCGQWAIIKKVDQGVAFRRMNETTLAERAFEWEPGAPIAVKVSVEGDRLRATFGEGVRLEATDKTFASGKIGLTSDVPTRFGAVCVTCAPQSKRLIGASVAKRQTDEDARVASNPRMVLWKKIDTRGFGVGRNLRFGDLDGDGNLDILIPQQKRHGPGDSHSEVGCLTAVTFDGRLLWQNGRPDSWNHLLTNDVAVQIHDIDADGRNEVVYCRNFEIVVADGATGETKYKAPTPRSRHDSRFDRILGDCIAFADLRGLGAKRDIIIKDRYWNVWALNDRLEELWHLNLNTGHYPFPCDVNGDGRDELLIGYSLVSADGEILWSNDDKLQDHADGVAAVRFNEGDELRMLCAASDQGMIFKDLRGTILKHHHLGHVQNPTVAKLRPDLPGLQTVTVNFWGNQGIVHFFDADGNLYHDCEPANHGSMMLPVNWTGDGTEYWALSPHPTHGGLFDGWGRRCVRFPADGHPDQCLAVLDITGDCRDEIVVWDPWEIWVYTQADNPKPGRLYKPSRNPLCNSSNYQATVSLPGWNDR